MTDFGRRVGDMKKSVYDTDGDGVVDDAEKLESETLSEVQDHAPQAHAHTEAQIIDLDHNALKIVGVPVDATDKGNTKVLAYNSATQKLEYETQTTGGQTFVDRGDPATGDFEVGDLTTNNAWHDLDLSGIVTAGATHVCISLTAECACGTGKGRFRKNGNSNEYNMLWVTSYNPNKDAHISGFVALDGDLKIEYKIADITWATFRILVCGWII